MPFSMPPMGWTHWSVKSEDWKMLDDLLTKRLVDGMSAHDVQIRFPHFQKYKPDRFSKNLSCQKQDMGLWSSAVTTAEDTGVGHDLMTGLSSPPDFHTAIPVVSPIPTRLFCLFPPPVARTPE